MTDDLGIKPESYPRWHWYDTVLAIVFAVILLLLTIWTYR